MLIVGLTGNIASGKSSVAAQLAAKGVPLIDADQLAREAVRPGSHALEAIVARWGPSVLLADGTLDRSALRRIVFANRDERAALDAIVHPAVAQLRDEAVTAARLSGARMVICDIPLLFETHLERTVDRIVLVDAPEELRRERLVRDRGLPAGDADAMIAAQMPSEQKRGRSNYVIDNVGSREELAARVESLWASLQQDAEAEKPKPRRSQT